MSDLIDRQALLKQIDIDSDGEPGYYGDTWKFIDTIKSMPPAEHGTNLAEVGTDCISREQAIEAFRTYFMDGFDEDKWWNSTHVLAAIEGLPPAEPDIIYCKDCSKHNKRIGDYVENSDGTYCWIWKGQACPLAEFRGVAQGHEFDYQFCAYGERRTE